MEPSTPKFINLPFHLGQIDALANFIIEYNKDENRQDRIATCAVQILEISQLIFENIKPGELITPNS